MEIVYIGFLAFALASGLFLVFIYTRMNNEMDFNWLRNVLHLESKKDYSNSKIGEALVLTVQDFQKIWEEVTENERQD